MHVRLRKPIRVYKFEHRHNGRFKTIEKTDITIPEGRSVILGEIETCSIGHLCPPLEQARPIAFPENKEPCFKTLFALVKDLKYLALCEKKMKPPTECISSPYNKEHPHDRRS